MSGFNDQSYLGFHYEDRLHKDVIEIVVDAIKRAKPQLHEGDIKPASTLKDLGFDEYDGADLGLELKEIFQLKDNNTTYDYLGDEAELNRLTLNRLIQIGCTNDPEVIYEQANAIRASREETDDDEQMPSGGIGVTLGHGWANIVSFFSRHHHMATDSVVMERPAHRHFGFTDAGFGLE